MTDRTKPSVLASWLALPSVPGNEDERRAYVQKRLSFFCGLATLAWVVMWVAVMAIVVATSEQFLGAPWWRVPLTWMQPVGVATFATYWLIARSGTPSIRTLATLDAVVVGTQTLFVAAYMLVQPLAERPEVSVTFGLVETLTLRAALVPSTPRRTAALGIAASIVFLAGVYVAYAFPEIFPSPHDGDPRLRPPWLVIIFPAAWLIVAGAMTTLVSRLMWNLERRVIEATRLGQYTLEKKIGEGGMGVVYRASHALLRRPTAIKLLPAEKAGALAIARFEREVQLTSSLTHPNTIAIYDYGRTPDGVFYYAMEYLDGIDLETIVREDGPQPVARVVHVLAQVAEALAEAHDASLVHRDVKPANLVLCDRRRQADFVKVLDFGLVKEIDAPADGALSVASAIAGTPLYLSPEAITHPERVDARSDLYALGCVGYFLVTGSPVFEGRSVVEVCSHHLHSTPVPPSVRLGRDVPADFEALLLSCLAKDPAARPSSAAALAERLEKIAAALDRWTPQRARAWWTSRAQAVRESRGRRVDVPSAHAKTLAVDPRGRAAA